MAPGPAGMATDPAPQIRFGRLTEVPTSAVLRLLGFTAVSEGFFGGVPFRRYRLARDDGKR